MAGGPFEIWCNMAETRELLHYLDTQDAAELRSLRRALPRWKDGSAIAVVARSDGYLERADEIRKWIDSRRAAERAPRPHSLETR